MYDDHPRLRGIVDDDDDGDDDDDMNPSRQESWPNGLASQRTLLIYVSFTTHLCRLALVQVDRKSTVYA